MDLRLQTETNSTTVIRPVTIDTNILIYSADARNPQKHEISTRILRTLLLAKGIIPLQCLNEFYRATTRKSLLPAEDAYEIVQQILRQVRIIPATAEDLSIAMQWHQQHGIQFFDALLIATARRAGCQTFFTEDMQNGRFIEGITLCNPFLLTPEELEEHIR